MKSTSMCSGTYMWCMGVFGARFAVFVRLACVLFSPRHATRNFRLLNKMKINLLVPGTRYRIKKRKRTSFTVTGNIYSSTLQAYQSWFTNSQVQAVIRIVNNPCHFFSSFTFFRNRGHDFVRQHTLCHQLIKIHTTQHQHLHKVRQHSYRRVSC